VIHVGAIALDSFLPFSLAKLIVPFAASYRPLWTGLGIAAAGLLLALAVTNHYRRRMPYRWWRAAHYLNFGVWGLASLHGLLARQGDGNRRDELRRDVPPPERQAPRGPGQLGLTGPGRRRRRRHQAPRVTSDRDAGTLAAS